MNPKNRRIYHFLFSCLFLLTAGNFAVSVEAARLPVKIYTSADGLGSGFIDYLIRDSRGFMWFCTRDGLSRFDGARFVNYRIGEKASPPGIETVYETREGIYWISTTGGTYRFDPNDISQPDTSELRINAEYISPFRGRYFEDSGGTLWAFSDGIYRLEQQNGKRVFQIVNWKLPPKPGFSLGVIEIDESNDGSLWVSTNLGLGRRLPDGHLIFYPYEKGLSSINTSSIVPDKNGRIWLTRENEIFVIKPEAPETFADQEPLIQKPLTPTSVIEVKPEEAVPLPKAGGEIFQFKNPDFIEKWPVKKVFQSADGNIWITAENNLMQFAEGVLHLHTDAEGLPNVMVRMAEDVAGNLWISGQSALARLDRNGMVTFGQNDGANSSRFYAINEGKDGDIYFAGRDSTISRFDGKSFKSLRPQIEANAQQIWTSRYSFLSSDGDWWILTQGKLYRFSGVTEFSQLAGKAPSAVYTSEQGLKSNGMFQIFEDSGGDIWVSTRSTTNNGHGLARLKKGEDKFYPFTEAEGYPTGRAVSSFAEDRNGNLWMGFYEGGLARFNGDRFEVFNEKEGLPSGVLTDLLIDIKGRLWIGSALGGLLHLDDTGAKKPEFVYLTTNDGLTSNNVRTMTEDRFGRIYVGTVRGVDRLSPDTGRIKHYSVNDGLAADFVVDSHCDKNGNLWFATNNGVSRLTPLPDERNAPPQIFLGGLKIAGESQPISELGTTEMEKGDLYHTQNNLEVDFFGLDFRAGETLRYQYQLEGADADWSSPTEFRTVTYANLQPSAYRFLVRAINSEGIVSEKPAVVSFKILPPIWARWWFIALGVLLALGILIALERYRAARLSELKTAFGELTVSEERFRQLIEQSPFGIMIFAPDRSIRGLNEAYIRMWGGQLTLEDVQNWDFVNDEQMIKGGVVEGLSRVFLGEFVTFPPMVYDPQLSPLRERMGEKAEPKWIQAVAYPVKDMTGELREVICVLEDISERRKAEENLQKSREERLAELEKVRSRIATDLHDDIGASLTQIAVLSEVAQAQGRKGNGASSEPLTKISEVSNELVGTMSDIVWSINPQKDHLSDLTQRMRRFAADVLSARGIGFHFLIPETEEEITVNTNLRREVFLIFKETINNIVKHSEAKHAEIELKISDGNLILKITDDGKGFSEETGQNGQTDGFGGNGIMSMQKRAAEMNGEVDITSSKGIGTVVVLRLPLERTISV